MKDQYLFDEWQAALNHKQAVLNNKESYWETRTIAVNRKKRTGYFGQTITRWTEYHEERAFNHDKFNSDLTNADNAINNCAARIDQKINQYKEELVQALKVKADIDALKQEISYLRNKAGVMYESASSIQNMVSNANYELSKIQSDIRRSSHQISLVKTKLSEFTHDLQVVKNENASLVAEVNELDKAIFQQIESSDLKQRAEMVVALFDNPDAAGIIAIIERFGFDATHLAYQAIKTNNTELLEYAIDHKADCISFGIKDDDSSNYKTLLQIAIVQNKSACIEQILSNETNLSTTLLNAALNSDLITLEFLAARSPQLLHQKINGYTIFHSSISAGNIEAVKKILAIDSSCTKDLTNRGESGFIIALRSADQSMIDFILPKLDHYHELSTTIKRHDAAWFEKAVALLTPAKSTMQLLLIDALVANEKSIATHLIGMGADCGEVFNKALENKDDNLINSIIEIEPSLIGMLPETNVDND